MKKALICALLTVALACCGTALYAQMQDNSGQGGGMHHGPMSVDQRLQHMTQTLNLSSDQQQKIRPILENESQQMESLRSDTSMSREDRMAKMRSIRQNSMSQITPILTADQQQKWQQMQANHMHHNGAMSNGEPGSQPAPPQP